VKFSTYAVWWIRRSMLDAIAGSNVIRMPARATRHSSAVRRADAELDGSEARRGSDAAIAEPPKLRVATVRALGEAARVTASLDESVGEDATPLGDLLADARAGDPFESAIAGERRDEVGSMLRLLPNVTERSSFAARASVMRAPNPMRRSAGGSAWARSEAASSNAKRCYRLRSIAPASTRAA
jgi:RNA polymerase primary sigma factor